jgi:hypothetical protein
VHHLDAAFRTFVQDDLSVNEYCHEFKAMTSDLADLSTLVEDRILVLNILLGLNQCFEHVDSIIRCYSPFPNFLKVQDNLLLEEVHTDSTGPPTAPTTLHTNVASLAAKPLSSTPSHLPNGGNNGIGGNRTKYINKNRNSSNGGGKNSNGGTGRGGYFGQTTTHWFRRQDQLTIADLWPPVAGAHDCVPWPCAHWTTVFACLRGHTGPLRVSQPLIQATVAAAVAVVPASHPSPRVELLARRKLGPAVTGQLL